MVDQAASGTMVMAGEVGGMAGDALAAASDSRGLEGAVAGDVMAGSATLGRMGLANAYEGRGGGGMAARAVCCGRGSSQVFLDLVSMAVDVAVEIGGMTLDAGATIAAIDRGIAMAIDPNPATAVFWVMAGGT